MGTLWATGCRGLKLISYIVSGCVIYTALHVCCEHRLLHIICPHHAVLLTGYGVEPECLITILGMLPTEYVAMDTPVITTNDSWLHVFSVWLWCHIWHWWSVMHVTGSYPNCVVHWDASNSISAGTMDTGALTQQHLLLTNHTKQLNLMEAESIY